MHIIKRFLEWIKLKEKLHGNASRPPLFNDSPELPAFLGRDEWRVSEMGRGNYSFPVEESSERVCERALRTEGSERNPRSPNALCSCTEIGRAEFTYRIG